MENNRVTLDEAIKFHGHLGPYLILGILAGELGLKKLGCKKYFGLEIKVWGANEKPKSCLIDGLQLSTGATFGKGNIQKLNSNKIKVLIRDLENNKNIEVSFDEGLINSLNNLKGHRDSELFAKRLYRSDPSKILNLTTYDL